MAKNYTKRPKEDFGSYTRRVTRNRIAPPDGSEALTVVEFSLLPGPKQKLKDALDAFKARNGSYDDPALGDIIKANMPEQILTEMGSHAKEKGLNTVYVIHNLPEVSDAVFRKSYKGENTQDISLDTSYNMLIQTSIAHAIGLKPVAEPPFRLLRQHKVEVPGARIHRHRNEIDSLGAVVSDGASTRYIDMQSFMEEMKTLRDNPKYIVESRIEDQEFKHSLSDFIDNYKPRTAIEQNIMLLPMTPLVEEAIERYSQEVVLKKGSVAFWANDSNVWYQALHTQKKVDTAAITRFACGTGYSRA